MNCSRSNSGSDQHVWWPCSKNLYVGVQRRRCAVDNRQVWSRGVHRESARSKIQIPVKPEHQIITTKSFASSQQLSVTGKTCALGVQMWHCHPDGCASERVRAPAAAGSDDSVQDAALPEYWHVPDSDVGVQLLILDEMQLLHADSVSLGQPDRANQLVMALGHWAQFGAASCPCMLRNVLWSQLCVRPAAQQ